LLLLRQLWLLLLLPSGLLLQVLRDRRLPLLLLLLLLSRLRLLRLLLLLLLPHPGPPTAASAAAAQRGRGQLQGLPKGLELHLFIGGHGLGACDGGR
jgi:hypothetical protein